MKKYLLLLPVAGLLLTGCGEPEKYDPMDKNIPGGGKEVSLNNEDDVNAAIDKLSSNIFRSFDSLMKGVKANGSFNITNLEVESSAVNFKATNVGFDYTFAINNIDKKLSEWEVAVELNGVHGKVVVNHKSETNKHTFEASNINLGMYLKNGNVYVNASDASLALLANSIMAYVVPEGQLPLVQPVVQQYLKKGKIDNVLGLIGIPDQKILPELSEEDINSAKQDIFNSVKELVKDPAKAPFGFVNYNDNGLAMIVQYGEDQEDISSVYGVTKVSSFVTGNVVFNKEGNLAKVYASETANVEVQGVKVVAAIEEGIAFEYGTGAVKMPVFSEYTNFDLSFLSSIKIPSQIDGLHII